MSLNHATFIGRLGHDPVLTTTQNGISVCSFSVAVPRDRVDDSGNRPVDWIRCIAWRQRADFIAKYFRKGSNIAVDGRIEVRSFEDKQGIARVATELNIRNVYFVDKRPDGEVPPPTQVQPPIPSPEDYVNGDDDGDLPF